MKEHKRLIQIRVTDDQKTSIMRILEKKHKTLSDFLRDHIQETIEKENK